MARINLPTPTGYDGSLATQKKMGIVRFATATEAAAQTATDVCIAPSQVTSSVPDASTTVKGKVELATSAETVTGSDTDRAVVPAGLTARLAAPGAIGGTTPAAGSFTTLSTTTTVTAGTDITATLGNVVINGAAKQLRVHGGAVTDFIGEATLASGTVTILNTNIASTDRVFISRRSVNGSTTLGELTYVINAATSLVITSAILGTPGSTQTGDTSIVAYFIVRQV